MTYPYSYYSCPCTDTSVPIKTAGNADYNQQENEESAEEAFDPKSPRTNFSLYPLDHLMWCEDCHDIKCPRCTVEEIVCWYCPSCLFEVPSSTVRSEGNRCTRNCFNCPACTAPLAVSTPSRTGNGPFNLACDYCAWTTLDIQLSFDKPTNLFTQLSKLRPTPVASSPERADPSARFASLKAFYASQLSHPSSSSANPLLSPSATDYNSPSSLARILSLYAHPLQKSPVAKPVPMREATLSEGLLLTPRHSTPPQLDFGATPTHAQRASQPHPIRTLDELWPVPTLLRTKRASRCQACRHILVRPEAKVQSTRHKIKLVAANHIPSLTLTPLSPARGPVSLPTLPASTPLQFQLVLTNPLFDPVRVSLAAPPRTAGARVTILCPAFAVGANADAWEEALTGARAARAAAGVSAKADDGRVPEAGKIWASGRNWTAVVVEVVSTHSAGEGHADGGEVLEVPVRVRVEWEAPGEEDGKGKGERREVGFWCVVGVGRVEGG